MSSSWDRIANPEDCLGPAEPVESAPGKVSRFRLDFVTAEKARDSTLILPRRAGRGVASQ